MLERQRPHLTPRPGRRVGSPQLGELPDRLCQRGDDLGVPSALEPPVGTLPDEAGEMPGAAGEDPHLGMQGVHPLPQRPLGGAGSLGPHHPSGEMNHEQLVHARRGRFDPGDPVPPAQQPQRRRRGRVVGGDPEHHVAHLPPRDHRPIELEGGHVVEIPLVVLGEPFGDPRQPVPVDEVVPHEGVAFSAERPVVGGGDEPGLRIHGVRQVGDVDEPVGPAGRRVPAGGGKGAVAGRADRGVAGELPRDVAVVVSGHDVDRQARPMAVGLAQLLRCRHRLHAQHAASGHRVEPGGAQRDRGLVVGEGGTDDGAVRRFEHLLDDGLAALDVDRLVVDRARDELVADAHTRPVRTDLLEEQIGVVDQAGGHPPGTPAVEADREGRRPHQGGTGEMPLRRGHMGEVPVGRVRGGEVGVVRNDGATGCGAVSGNRPVVRSPAHARRRGEQREIGGEPIDGGTGRLAHRDRRRQPLGIGRFQRQHRLHPVLGDHLVAHQLGIPVRCQQEGHELHETEHVGDFVAARPAPEQGELVRHLRRAGRRPLVGTRRIGVEHGADVVVEYVELGE